ncbi:MAG: lipoate--protein ligase [Clostridia bacterium]|nr:lipoate--protein ligase [Clostridia bacterium]
MIIIQNPSVDPYFNLAAEQYLIDNCDEDVFMLWRNEKTVVIGNNQNAYAEVDREYADTHGIKVSRRLTGGGAVFHDLGNVNFSFIIPSDGKGIDFKRYTEPIINSLKKMGLTAELSGRNDILIDGKKVSGNAQCVRNGKVLHHGTLLYSADLSKVAGVLRVDPTKLRSKGIKSVKSRVANIKDLLCTDMDVCEFMAKIEADFEGERRSFTDTELCGINKLRCEKFATWDWIWGRSKEYTLTAKQRFDYGSVEVNVNTDRGIIKEVKLTGDFFGNGDVSELTDTLKGIRYEYADVLAHLSKYDVQRYIFGSSAEDISKLLFKNSLL